MSLVQGGNQSNAFERSMVVKAALSDACHAARTGSASFGHQDGRQPGRSHCCCSQHHPTVVLAVCTSIAAGGWEGLTEMPQWQKFWLNLGQRLPELGSEAKQKLQQAHRHFLSIVGGSRVDMESIKFTTLTPLGSFLVRMAVARKLKINMDLVLSSTRCVPTDSWRCFAKTHHF